MNSSQPPPSSDPGPASRDQLGASTRPWFRRSLKHLPAELEPGESVYLLAIGGTGSFRGAGVVGPGLIVFLGVLIGLDWVVGWSFLPSLLAAWVASFAVDLLVRRARRAEPAVADPGIGLLAATDRRLLLLARRGEILEAVPFAEIRSVATNDSGWLGAKTLTVVTSDGTLAVRVFSDVPKRTAARALTELGDHVKCHLPAASADALGPEPSSGLRSAAGEELRAP